MTGADLLAAVAYRDSLARAIAGTLEAMRVADDPVIASRLLAMEQNLQGELRHSDETIQEAARLLDLRPAQEGL